MSKRKIIRIILNLFDGAGAGGAEGGGDGESTSAAVNPAAQSRGREIGVSSDLMEDYQKAFWRDSSDGEESNPQNNNNEQETEQSDDEDASFEELIKGKYKDAYQKKMSQAVMDRLNRANKDREALETKAAKSDRLLTLLAEKYGNSDPDALYEAVRADGDLWRQAAIDKGQTAEEFMNDYDKRQNEAEQQRELEELRRYRAANELNSRLQMQAEETRKQYPGFNLEQEFANPRFRAALDMVAAQNEESFRQSGKSGEVYDITYAYELAHADELRNNQIQRVSKATASAVAQTIQANRNRARENAAGTPTPSPSKSYRDYTDEEFEAKLERVKRGEDKI